MTCSKSMMIAAVLMICCSSGCSKLRQLTRRDYALLDDPFAAPLVDDESSEQPPGKDVKTSTAGFVQIGGADASGNSPVADYGNVERTQTAATESPSGSGVVQGVGNGERSRRSGPSLNDLNASGTENAASNMADMASFMNEQARASGLNETADELQEDFAAFAAQQERQWEEEVATVRTRVPDSEYNVMNELTDGTSPAPGDDSATPLIRQTQHSDGAAGLPIEERPPAAARNVHTSRPAPRIAERVGPKNAPIGDPSPFVFDESAEQPQQKTTVPEPVFEDPKRDVVKDAEPTDNPFAAFEARKKQGGEQPESRNTLDSGFSFDTGWRPSTVVNPND